MKTKEVIKKKFSLSRYIEDIKAEIKKVVWPTKKVLLNSTLTILIIMVLLTAYVSGADFLIGKFSILLKIVV